jgi:hypothetical protein
VANVDDERGRCGTCKHWDNSPIFDWVFKVSADGVTPISSREVNPNARRWNCHGDDQQLGECQKANQDHRKLGNDGWVDVVTSPLMQAVDKGESIYGELVTDARFGCILHEPRESEEIPCLKT